MVKVVFTQTVTTREAQPQTFEEGKTYDLPETSAARWENRSMAKRVTEEAPAVKAKAEPASMRAEGLGNAGVAQGAAKVQEPVAQPEEAKAAAAGGELPGAETKDAVNGEAKDVADATEAPATGGKKSSGQKKQ